MAQAFRVKTDDLKVERNSTLSFFGFALLLFVHAQPEQIDAYFHPQDKYNIHATPMFIAEQLRLTFMTDEVLVGVVIRSVEWYDLEKTRLPESEADAEEPSNPKAWKQTL